MRTALRQEIQEIVEKEGQHAWLQLLVVLHALVQHTDIGVLSYNARIPPLAIPRFEGPIPAMVSEPGREQ